MSRFAKGLFLAGFHVALVLSVVAKYRSDRASLPRVWARAVPYDPNLPIRGRYVRLQVEVEIPAGPTGPGWAILSVDNDRLVATPSGPDAGLLIRTLPGNRVALQDAVAYFIPEHIPDPSRRPLGEELWVEVSVPKRGPPRPIRLGVRKDGQLTPLDTEP